MHNHQKNENKTKNLEKQTLTPCEVALEQGKKVNVFSNIH